MLMPRALSGALNRRTCQHFTPGKFSVLTGAYLPSPSTSSQGISYLQTRSIARTNVRSIRNFTSLHVNRADRPDRFEHNILEDDASFDQTTIDESVPWYLRIQNVVEPENTLLERQRLPDVPEDAPYQLAEILNHLSKGIGLEYLTVLDLRALDPPPALGSNLIMVIGTARSIRHLNVSADRLCRWLRSTYKLSPHADGLLGRNELKLKLRRRARRAKILGNKLRPSDGDDGITTGWICVNAGALTDEVATDQLVQSEDGSVIGFGQDNQNTHIVVQLLTEERRASLDLEGLWKNYLERQRRRLEMIDPEAEPNEPHERPAILPQDSSPKATPNGEQKRTDRFVSSERSASVFHSGQKRGYHTITSTPFPRNSLSSSTKYRELSGRNKMTGRRLVQSQVSGLTQSTAAQDLLHRLSKRSPDEAVAALGTGCNDKTSTPFLISFYSEVGVSPTIDQYRARLLLAQLAIDLRHPGYNLRSLVLILKEACESLVTVSNDLYLSVIDQFVRLQARASLSDTDAHSGAEHISTLLDILEDMSLRGMNIFTPHVMENLCDIIVKFKQTDPKAAAEYLCQYPLGRLALLANEHNFSLSQTSRCLAVLEDLISSHTWDGVWRAWAWLPIREERRPPELYAAVFRMMAATKHQRVCIEALTKMVPTMELENPPVKVEGDTALALMECLKVADPGVQSRHADSPVERHSWNQLFQTCVEGLKSSPAGEGEVIV